MFPDAFIHLQLPTLPIYTVEILKILYHHKGISMPASYVSIFLLKQPHHSATVVLKTFSVWVPEFCYVFTEHINISIAKIINMMTNA